MFESAKRYLRIYFDNAKSKLPFNTFEDFIQHYRVDSFLLENYGEYVEHDDFLEGFEKALSYSSHEDSKSAMLMLSSLTIKDKTPSSQSFYDALSSQVESISFDDVKEITKKSIDEIKNFSLKTIAIYIAVGVVTTMMLTKVVEVKDVFSK